MVFLIIKVEILENGMVIMSMYVNWENNGDRNLKNLKQ